jgi:hypothetical protein
VGQVNACGQRSTREGWASSMSCPPSAPVRTRVLKDDLAGVFRRWYPCLSCTHPMDRSWRRDLPHFVPLSYNRRAG